MNPHSASTVRYSTGAIAFHWIIAVLIALNFAAVWTAHAMPKPVAALIMANHKAIGITILTLSVLRIVWRLTHRAPEFAASLRPWERALARVTHTLFYVLMIGIPLTGWAMVSAETGKAVSVFGFFSLPPLPLTVGESGPGETLHDIHGDLAWVMLALLALHVTGALKHQFLDRDGTLGRMIPWFARR